MQILNWWPGRRADIEARRLIHAFYQGFLRREPDPPGLESRVTALIAGRSGADIAEEFLACAEFKARNVKLFVPPGHHYSPIVDPAEASRHLDRLATRGPQFALPGIEVDRDRMFEEWRTFLPFFATMPFDASPKDGLRYGFDNPAYSWGDGSIVHAMLRRCRPKRLIEIGSGWSSACAIDTIERFFETPCHVTFIEPYPELLDRLVGSTALNVRRLNIPVQQTPIEFFEELEAGDILFIDSTHVLRTGSDVCFELFEILPRLKPGVFVHFHDIFWPFEYPRNWAVDENRSWNELYALRLMLTNSPHWRIVFFNDYFYKIAQREIEATYPAFLNNPGGALWLEKR
jgi:Methyltransferase domain